MVAQLSSRQFRVRIETIVDEIAEKEEGVEDRDRDDQARAVVDIPPRIERVSDATGRRFPHLREAAKVLRWEVRTRVHCREKDHHHQRKLNEPVSILSAPWRARFRPVSEA